MLSKYFHSRIDSQKSIALTTNNTAPPISTQLHTHATSFSLLLPATPSSLYTTFNTTPPSQYTLTFTTNTILTPSLPTTLRHQHIHNSTMTLHLSCTTTITKTITVLRQTPINRPTSTASPPHILITPFHSLSHLQCKHPLQSLPVATTP